MPKTSDELQQGIVDEIRLFNNLNVRFQVGKIIKNPQGGVIAGWHYAESQFLELVEAGK